MRSKFFDKETHYHLGRPDHHPSIGPFLAQNFDASKTVLEIGAGNGRGTKHLTQHFKKVIVIEPVAQLSAMAKNVFNAANIELYSVPLEEAGEPDITFDYLICFQATHWFYDSSLYQTFYAKAQKPVLDISTQVKILDQPDFFQELVSAYEIKDSYRGFRYPREVIFKDMYEASFSVEKVAHGICSTSWIDHLAFDEILKKIEKRFGEQGIQVQVITEVRKVAAQAEGKN